MFKIIFINFIDAIFNNNFFCYKYNKEIKLQFAKYFLDGVIGKLTWGTIKKPRLEDRTVHFKLNESVTHLSGLSKAQYAEIGFNPIRDEFELVCSHFYFYNYVILFLYIINSSIYFYIGK